MKSLLKIITKPLLVYVLSIFVLSIPIYYFVVEKIWVGELDEHNLFIARKAKSLLEKQISENKNIESFIEFWNNTQLDVSIKALPEKTFYKDSVYTTDAINAHIHRNSNDNFRVLNTILNIAGKPYFLSCATSFENTRKIVLNMAIIALVGYCIILIGFYLHGRWLSNIIRRPFNNILVSVRNFNVKDNNEMQFSETNIVEFEELKQALTILAKNNVFIYNAQKQFIENASHELKTPLALLKNQMDLLLQSQDLTSQQYQMIEDMNIALMRSNRMIKNLLLLAKMDNDQFHNGETINLNSILTNCIELLYESFLQKKVSLDIEKTENLFLTGNAILADILISNLLVNVLNYTPDNGYVRISHNNFHLKVCNSGEKPLDKEKLFQRFARQSVSKEGSGLGLSIVWKICQFHKWKIEYSLQESLHIFTIFFFPMPQN